MVHLLVGQLCGANRSVALQKIERNRNPIVFLGNIIPYVGGKLGSYSRVVIARTVVTAGDYIEVDNTFLNGKGVLLEIQVRQAQIGVSGILGGNICAKYTLSCW